MELCISLPSSKVEQKVQDDVVMMVIQEQPFKDWYCTLKLKSGMKSDLKLVKTHLQQVFKILSCKVLHCRSVLVETMDCTPPECWNMTVPVVDM
jgi:hypothetical protein